MKEKIDLKLDFDKHLSSIQKFYEKYGKKIELLLIFDYEIENPFKEGVNGDMMWNIYRDEIFNFYVDSFDRTVFWKFEIVGKDISLCFKNELYGKKIIFDKMVHDDPNQIFTHILIEYLKINGIESNLYGFNKMVINYKNSSDEIDVTYICGTI